MKTKPNEVAACQNEFFINKVENLVKNLPPPIFDPIPNVERLLQGRTGALEFSCVHPDEVLKIIGSLSNSAAFGLDEIDTTTLKMVKDEITPAVTHIINLSIKTKVFPEGWKSSKVVPIHKKDNILDPSNYRPVSLIPVLSKILEKIVFKQTLQYLTEHDLLHPSHHAFRQGHSTSTALIEMVDGWIEAIERGKMAGVCLLDMSAAFDLVNHSLLIRKLRAYGFSSGVLDWF